MCIVFVLYGFIQPYKSRITNFIEMMVQVIFIILLALESTSFLRDVYNVFPAPARVTTSVNPNATDACTDGLSGVCAQSRKGRLCTSNVGNCPKCTKMKQKSYSPFTEMPETLKIVNIQNFLKHILHLFPPPRGEN